VVSGGAGPGPVHLDQRVVGGGRAVEDALGASEKLGERETLARGQAAKAAHHALARVVECGRRLVEVQGAVRPNQHEMGEGPADVDPDAIAALGAARRLLNAAEAHASPGAGRCGVVWSMQMSRWFTG